jgi:outer membrane protein TolC
MRKIGFLLIFMVLSGGVNAFGLTLEDAVRMALENNHRIKQFGYLHDSAEANVGTSRAGFLPLVDLRYTYTEREDPVVFGGEHSHRYTAEATYNLFNGLADFYGVKSAKSNAQAASYNRKAVVADVVLAAKEAYIRVLRAKSLLETARESVELLERQRNDAELFYREGLFAKNDLLKVEVELASARQELVVAEGNRRISRSSLERVISERISEEEVLTDFEELPSMDDLTFEALKEEMLGRRSELRYLKSLKEVQKFSASSIRGGYIPAVDLAITYEKFEDSGSFAGADLSVEDTRAIVNARWNIFDGFSKYHRMREAKYQARSFDEELKDTEQEMVFQLREAMEQYEVAEGTLDVAKTAVAQAEENYRVTENQFRERAATTTDLLDARTFLTRARVQYSTALYDIHIAASRIERVLERGVPEGL